MPHPRWKPRDYCVQPDSFGRSEVSWAEPPRALAEWSKWQAARSQHELICRLRNVLGRRLDREQWDEKAAFRVSAPYSRLGLYAVITQTPYARVKELFSGRAPMRLEEFYAGTQLAPPPKG